MDTEVIQLTPPEQKADFVNAKIEQLSANLDEMAARLHEAQQSLDAYVQRCALYERVIASKVVDKLCLKD